MRHQCAFSRVVTACQYEQNITPRLPPVVHERVDGGGGEESGWGWRRGEVMGVAERRGDGGGGEERGWGGLSLTIAAVVPPTAASRSILWKD